MSNYTYRFRLYPKERQIEFLNKQVGHCRFVYNRLLEMAKEKKDWDYYKYKKLLPKLKQQYPFLKEANSQSLQEAIKNLHRAFRNFFEGRGKYPRFKKKKYGGSMSIPQHFKIEDNRIKIPKLTTPIRFIKHREIRGLISTLTPKNQNLPIFGHFSPVISDVPTTFFPISSTRGGTAIPAALNPK